MYKIVERQRNCNEIFRRARKARSFLSRRDAGVLLQRRNQRRENPANIRGESWERRAPCRSYARSLPKQRAPCSTNCTRFILSGYSNFLRETKSSASAIVKVFLLFLFNVYTTFNTHTHTNNNYWQNTQDSSTECPFSRPHPVDGRRDFHTERRIYNSRNFLLSEDENPHAVRQGAFQYRWTINV